MPGSKALEISAGPDGSIYMISDKITDFEKSQAYQKPVVCGECPAKRRL
jgi:hypothetical protein